MYPPRFADFYDGALPFQMSSIPEGGMCLSAFLVLWNSDPHKVLLGKINKDYDWIRIGALDKDGATRASKGWMLPSSHLKLFESPDDAAERILSKQLGLAVPLKDPRIFSEVYDAPEYERNHWDIEFVFTGEVLRDKLAHPAWTQLEFKDVAKMKREEFARNHQDILSELGLR